MAYVVLQMNGLNPTSVTENNLFLLMVMFFFVCFFLIGIHFMQG